MTDMTDRLDEIRARLHAWTHWQRAAGKSVEEAAKKVEWYFTRQHCVSTEPSLPSMLRALKHGT